MHTSMINYNTNSKQYFLIEENAFRFNISLLANKNLHVLELRSYREHNFHIDSYPC